MLPLNIDRLLLIGLGFVVGLTIDTFDDLGGIHAASCVFIAFTRPIIVKLITPQGGYDNHSILTLNTNGFRWFLVYASICTFIHHLLLYTIERFNFGQFWEAFGNAILSTIFTLVVIILTQYLFFVPRKYK